MALEHGTTGALEGKGRGQERRGEERTRREQHVYSIQM